jgi:hypothetical protein
VANVFRPEPSITHVPATRDAVVAIVESINQPQVSIPGKPAQAVSGHLVAIRNGGATFAIFVALHLPKSGENVVYVHDRGQLGLDDYRQVESEGLQFLESMGFMLDNLNFRNLSPDAQEQTLRRIPLFSPPRPTGTAAPATPGAQPAPADPVRVARLLASF